MAQKDKPKRRPSIEVRCPKCGVRDFASWGEYLDWLKAEYDDGTIRWEDE